jgi:hypothetical protein
MVIPETTIVPCYEQDYSHWTYQVQVTDAQVQTWTKREMKEILQDEMSTITRTQQVQLEDLIWTDDNTAILVFSNPDSFHWDEMTAVFEDRLLLSQKAPFFHSLTLNSIYCLDAPENTPVNQLVDCTLGEPCEFLGGVALKDYTGIVEQDVIVEDSSVAMFALTLLSVLLSILF